MLRRVHLNLAPTARSRVVPAGNPPPRTGHRSIQPTPSPTEEVKMPKSGAVPITADASGRASGPKRVGPIVKLQAWYLGVDPSVLARYGDGKQTYRLWRVLGASIMVYLLAADQYSGYDTLLRKQRAIMTMDENRKRFYGHDFEQPMGEGTRNFGKSTEGAQFGDKNYIIEADERTALLRNADGKLVAPAKYERDVRPQNEITEGMMTRISNLSKMSQGYMPTMTTGADSRAAARVSPHSPATPT